MLDVETGAGAVGELVVSVDGGDRVLFPQVSDELEEGEALGFGAGVGGMSSGSEAADIGDADTVGVGAGAMGTDLLDGAAGMDAAIRVDDIVIADVVPAEALMVAADALHGTDSVGTCGGAMDDDFGDCSHFFVGLMGLMGVFGLRRCSLHKVAGHTSSIQDKGEQADCLRQIPPFWGYASPL